MGKFEQVEAHVNAVDVDKLESELGGKSFAAGSDDWLKQLCVVYKAVKPILELILPILPEKMRKLVVLFMKILDGVCPN